MTRFWNWLFPPKPAVQTPRTFREIWPSMYGVIAEYRPDLEPHLDSFIGRSMAAFVDWLDAEFPRERGWGQESIANTENLLRRYLEAAK